MGLLESRARLERTARLRPHSSNYPCHSTVLASLQVQSAPALDSETAVHMEVTNPCFFQSPYPAREQSFGLREFVCRVPAQRRRL